MDRIHQGDFAQADRERYMRDLGVPYAAVSFKVASGHRHCCVWGTRPPAASSACSADDGDTSLSNDSTSIHPRFVASRPEPPPRRQSRQSGCRHYCAGKKEAAVSFDVSALRRGPGTRSLSRRGRETRCPRREAAANVSRPSRARGSAGWGAIGRDKRKRARRGAADWSRWSLR